MRNTIPDSTIPSCSKSQTHPLELVRTREIQASSRSAHIGNHRSHITSRATLRLPSPRFLSSFPSLSSPLPGFDRRISVEPLKTAYHHDRPPYSASTIGTWSSLDMQTCLVALFPNAGLLQRHILRLLQLNRQKSMKK